MKGKYEMVFGSREGGCALQVGHLMEVNSEFSVALHLCEGAARRALSATYISTSLPPWLYKKIYIFMVGKPYCHPDTVDVNVLE